MSTGHTLPPYVEGNDRAFISLTVDEVVWISGSGEARVRAEWWGSRDVDQIIFTPVDVRDFNSRGSMLVYTYPIRTSEDKLKQYLTDATPLSLSLLDKNSGEEVGQAKIDNLCINDLEGYYPVWNEKLGREIANLHVRMVYRSNEGHQIQEVDMDKLKQSSEVEKSKNQIKEPPSNRVSPNKAAKVTFSDPETMSRNKLTPLADSLISDLLSQSAELRASMKLQLVETERQLCTDQLSAKENEPPYHVKPLGWNLTVPQMKSLACVTSLTTTVVTVTLNSQIVTRLRRPLVPARPNFVIPTKRGERQNRSHQREQNVSLFVSFSIPGVGPGGKEVKFCPKKLMGDKAEFEESHVASLNVDTELLDTWWTVPLVLFVYCRQLNQRSSLQLGSASVNLKHLLSCDQKRGLSLSLPLYSSQSLHRDLGLSQAQLKEIVGTVSVCLKLGISQPINRPISPLKPERESSNKVTLHSTQGGVCPNLEKAIIFLLTVDPGPGCAPDLIFCHKTWGGKAVTGTRLTVLEPLLLAGVEGRIVNRQMLSRLVENYVVIEVWTGDILLGIARITTAKLLADLRGWRSEDQPVEGASGLVEVVGLLDGNVVGHISVQMWAGTEDTLPKLEVSGKSDSKGIMTDKVVLKKVGVDKEIMTDIEVDTEIQKVTDVEQDYIVNDSLSECMVDVGENKNYVTQVEQQDVTTGYDSVASDSDTADSHEIDTILSKSDVITVNEIKKTAEDLEISSRNINDLDSNKYLLKIDIEEGRNLAVSSSSRCVYCTLAGGLTTPLIKCCQLVRWDYTCQVKMGHLLEGGRRHLIIKVWQTKDDTVNMDPESDLMLGFVAVDLSPFKSMSMVSGWYNIMDWLGKCKGQVKVTVVPQGGREEIVCAIHESPPNCQGRQRIQFNVTAEYNQFPSQKEQFITKVQEEPSGRSSRTSYDVSFNHLTENFNFLPPDPSRSFLERSLDRNLSDLAKITQNLTDRINRPQINKEYNSLPINKINETIKDDNIENKQETVDSDKEDSQSLDNTNTYLVDPPLSLSMLQATLDHNLQSLRKMSAGEHPRLLDSQVFRPLDPLPDLSIVLADLNLDIDLSDDLRSEVVTERSRVGPEGGNTEY